MELLNLIVYISIIWMRINANESPKVQPFLLPKSPEPCDEVNAMCSAKSNSWTELKWLKDGVRLGSDPSLNLPNTTVSNVGTVLLLSIKCVSAAHSGNYSCTAQNSFGTDEFTVPLIITSSPFWLEGTSQSSSVFHVTVGETVELRCPAGGYPKPNVVWYREGVFNSRLFIRLACQYIFKMENLYEYSI